MVLQIPSKLFFLILLLKYMSYTRLGTLVVTWSGKIKKEFTRDMKQIYIAPTKEAAKAALKRL